MNNPELFNPPNKDFRRYLNKSIYEQCPDNMKRQLHEAWRNDPNIKVTDIKEALGMEKNYYDVLNRLGVPYPKKPFKTRKKRTFEKKPPNACEISFNGINDPQQLIDQIERLKAFIDVDSNSEYEFHFKIKETAE